MNGVGYWVAAVGVVVGIVSDELGGVLAGGAMVLLWLLLAIAGELWGLRRQVVRSRHRL